MVWRVLKNYVATKNKDMTLKSVKELFRKKHAELKDQPEFWKKCVEKVKRLEEDYRKSDISVDIQVEKLCVELHPDSLSDSDELDVCLAKCLTLRVNQPYYWHVFFLNIERLLLVIIIQGVTETCDSQGYTAWSVTYFCFCKSALRNSIVPQCALDCCRFLGTPCILYYTLYSLKETLRDQCTPTQKVMLLLFIINPLIQENTNNVVKGTSNEAFCPFKIGFDWRPV